jgi:hypothetical protein
MRSRHADSVLRYISSIRRAACAGSVLELVLLFTERVEGRDTWKALQAKLSLARERLDAKDYAAALEAVQAALAIDPDFLAAHSLRQRIELDRLADPPGAPPPSIALPASEADDAPANSAVTPAAGRRFGALLADVYGQNRLDHARPVEVDPVRLEVDPVEVGPVEVDPVEVGPVEVDSVAPAEEPAESIPPADQPFTPTADQVQVFVPPSSQEFILRNHQESIARSDLHEEFTPRDDLFSAADVSRESNFSELPLKSEVDVDDFYRDSYDGAQTSRLTGIIQVSIGAAVLIAVILVDQPDRYPRLIADYFNPPKHPEVARLLSASPVRAQIGELVAGGRSVEFERPASNAPSERQTSAAPAIHTVREGPAARVTEPAPTTMLVATADGPIEVPAPPPSESTPPPAPTPPPAAPVAVSASAVLGDEQGVKQALQRYRSAYDRLDARLAHTVWPSVNEAALARAFDSLQSQSLTFTACDVAFSGPAAVATCEGTMRYTPRVGSRDSRVEPHVWTFTLRKRGPEWQIDSVKAAR